MKVFFVSNIKPRSHNKSGSGEKYKNLLKNEFNVKYSKLYSGLPIAQETLQAHVVYIHQLRLGNIPDADNLSKPIVDAFSGVIYTDDRLIIRRTADILTLKDFDFMMIDATNMPLEVFNDFNDFINNKEQNIVFFEVGKFLSSQIKIGEI